MKHVLVTGVNKGIGLESTKLFLDLGFKVTIMARDFSNMAKLKNCDFLTFDLLNVEEIKNTIEKLEDVDILVNNAGIMNTFTYDNYPSSKKDEVLKINLEAPIELMNCVARTMIKNNSGRIVNNASIAGQIGHPDIWYGVSKAGLINATKSYAKQLGQHGIIINAIAASPVETDMLKIIPEIRKQNFLKTVHSGRFATPIEIAKTILWLSTESPEYINGTCIDINDGSFPR
jgi:NAD(P)-dependent dehydrogenase (short-subunit alcohol dehydrogenase family)